MRIMVAESERALKSELNFLCTGRRLPSGARPSDGVPILVPVICALTGKKHRLFWMHSAWWCEDCRQKIESCCEGGGCPSVAELSQATVAVKGCGSGPVPCPPASPER